ncbi:IQ motif and ankyrin repeat domain-containing protein 1-like [Tubulanus polymorphus]|uniref:IQ motif and ankyrin repeat domain-containing protein 1-like n=1 Tax=Tubulanus polymorphus TaxID=672921 RepID=UPI003DA1F80F
MPPKKPVAKAPAGSRTAPKVTAPVKTTTRATGVATGKGKQATPAGKKVIAGGAKKPAANGSNPKKSATPAEPKKKVWTKEDDAASKIQTKYRQFRSKKILEKKRQEKADYEELMDKLEKEAYVKMVKQQQEEAERLYQKEEEERKRKREELKRKKRFLEAAFDGDSGEIIAILKEVADLDVKMGLEDDIIGRVTKVKHQLSMINCEDANENTPISEAASGGHADTIKLLIEKGADINKQGQFQRTPLYRAAFAGHLDACQLLLQHGADPRIYASDGQTPEQVASQATVQEVLQSWDISQTESLLDRIEKQKEKRLEEDRKKKEAETNKLENQLAEVQKEYSVKQLQLNELYAELEKRIHSHDMAVASGYEKTNVTLQAVHDIEFELEVAKLDFEKARDKLAQAKLQLRDQERENQGLTGQELPGIPVAIKELDEVLLRDVGNRIKESGKWPLIIDPSGQASIFLRYRDTNYLNALRPHDMEPDRIRLALLGSIRFGKIFIIDMMEIDMYEACERRFDEIQKGLLDSVMDKSILQNERYLSFVKESDGPEYQKTKFNDLRVSNFRFYILSKNPYPSEQLMDRLYGPIRVQIPM